MNKQISVIGCGWLGLPLASELVKNGHTIKGSTTSVDKIDSLKSAGILPFLVTISEETISKTIDDCLKDSEILILNIPPGLRKNPEGNFVKQMELLCRHIERSSIKNVLYISSTSVYENSLGFPMITEESPTTGQSASAQQLIAVEKMLRTNRNFDTTILRFGGLIGKDRDPARFLSGKKNLKDPEGPVNLIHQTDAIAIIKIILKNQDWCTEFNAVAPEHPSREAYYTSVCKLKNLPLPRFDHSAPSLGKIISSAKVAQVLRYDFQHHL